MKEYRSVDKAWNLLHERLERDGLLADGLRKEPSHSIRHLSAKWIAGIAALFVGVVALGVFYVTGRPSTTDMLVLHNAKGDPTLVSSFEDGSIIYLAEQASVEYPTHFARDKREVSLSGNAFFEVSKNRQRPFIIQTEQATVEVIGTSFRVESQDKENFSLSVRTGMVKVTSRRDNSTVLVKAGETARIQSGVLQSVLPSAIDGFDNYLHHIHFKDQHLSDVARIINENTDSVQLKVDPSLGERRITVTFQNDSPETMARIICTVMNLHFDRQQNIINITRKE